MLDCFDVWGGDDDDGRVLAARFVVVVGRGATMGCYRPAVEHGARRYSEVVSEPEVVEPRRNDPISALRHRNFQLFWFAALVSNTGSWMQSAAIPYVVFELTRRNSAVGLTGFFQYVPIMLMGVVGGSLADRYDRRRLLLLSQVAQGAFAVALWAVVVTGRATVAWIAVLGFLSGLAGGLNIPVWQAFVTSLVPRNDLANAITLNSTQFNAARALGPFFAGAVIAAFGAGTAFAINAVSFIAVVGVLPFIRVTARPQVVGQLRVMRDLAAGARYVLATPGIRACCVAIIAIAGLGNPLFSFLPASYGQEIFKVSGWSLGLLAGAGGVGAVLIAPFLLTVGLRMSRERLLIIAMAAYGLGTALVGLAPTFEVALLGGIIFGGSYLAIASAINTTIQLLARDEMRGKSIAFYIMCLTGSLPIGLWLWGLAADHWGIRAVTVVAGLALVALTGVFAMTGQFAAMGAADAEMLESSP